MPITYAIGLDLGGTLTKMCFISPIPHPIQHHIVTISHNTYIFYSKMFNSPSQCFEFISHNFPCCQIAVTGGGAYKYKHALSQLNHAFVSVNEFQSLVGGLGFLIQQRKPITIVNSIGVESEQILDQTMFPYLLVNIGSGVSMLVIQHNYSFTRVGGTSLGGGFFMGLCKVMTGEESFERALEDVKNGKEVIKNIHDLTFMNICQLAILTSINHHTQNIIFTGSFTRNNTCLKDCFVKAIHQYNTLNPLQTIHRQFISLSQQNGYFGAIGTLLYHLRPHVHP